ncbi:MAG: hypothetical protein KF729_20560 [Sandaracinaceae bacterium]|nr:hypothetical protein [Sandaracinaceae bacterium]
MRRLALLVTLALAACANHVGPDGRVIGAPCVDVFDCAMGSFCLQRPETPGGLCTTNCRDDAGCRGDARCVALESGVCLLPCVDDEDCGRPGYGCRLREPREGGDAVSVCVGG